MKRQEFDMLLLKRFFRRDSLKVNILKTLQKKNYNYMELHKLIGCSMPLLSYHFNGNNKSEGLLELGLVEKVFKDERIMTEFDFTISALGKEILRDAQ